MPERGTENAGIGGLPPALSALTLRLILTASGLVIFLSATVASILLDVPYGVSLVFAAFAVVAMVNLIVVANRKYSRSTA